MRAVRDMRAVCAVVVVRGALRPSRETRRAPDARAETDMGCFVCWFPGPYRCVPYRCVLTSSYH
eukprot:scaffold32261_cov61-Phaeocystis_antarctica.AAC.9